MTKSSDAQAPSVPAHSTMSGTGHLAVGGLQLAARGGGFTSAPVPVTVDSLFASGVKQAQRGLRARHDGDHDDAAFHLGTMVEHLLKAVLVNLNPVLIHDKNPDFNSMLKLAGQGHRAKSDHSLRTVGFEEAMARVAQILHPIGGAGQTWLKVYKPIAAARNDAAHLGGSPDDPENIAELAVACARDLVAEIGRDLDDLFASYGDTARSLIEANTTKLERELQSRVDTARTAFLARYGTVPTPESEALLSLADIQAAVLGDDKRSPVLCPACGRTAVLSGFPYLDYPAAVDVGPHTSETDLHLLLSAERLDCPACHLHFDSAYEMFTAGVSPVADLRPSTAQDRETYPDLDDLWIDVDPDEDEPDDDDFASDPCDA
ncbi:hypothetical protein [Geodermatophilus sp. FMUSA9-8]|uniref:hypothetical protein n=1 Tax=Geodermatophilus sp. FMUSA9-8 TaxID=3120155 RepID=UPI00300A886F